jgi:hypothetical protein
MLWARIASVCDIKNWEELAYSKIYDAKVTTKRAPQNVARFDIAMHKSSQANVRQRGQQLMPKGMNDIGHQGPRLLQMLAC